MRVSLRARLRFSISVWCKVPMWSCLELSVGFSVKVGGLGIGFGLLYSVGKSEGEDEWSGLGLGLSVM